MEFADYDDGFGLEELDQELAELAGSETEGSAGNGAADPGWADGASRTERERLLSEEEAHAFLERWADVQASFVDEPKRTVEQADHLVDQVLKRLTEDLCKERDALVRRWDHGREEISTEELRQALKGYRTLLERLLRL